MGKYDIDKKLSDECKLTLTDLIQELMEERENEKKKVLSNAAYWQAFKAKKSGLIPKIKRVTGIDLEIYLEGKNKQEKFNALKILKCFYKIEKDGQPKNRGARGIDSLIKITDILQNPKLENIDSIYTSESVYGDVFEELYTKIRDNAEYGEVIETKYSDIELEWRIINHRILSYYRKWEYQKNSDKAMNELNILEKFLNEIMEWLTSARSFLEGTGDFKFFDESTGLNDDMVKLKEDKKIEEENLGVIDRLYVVLKSHKMLCMQTALIEAGKGSIEDVDIVDEYVERYNQEGEMAIGKAEWEKVIKYFEEYPKNESVDELTREIVYLILYGNNNLSREELNKYRYAVKKVWYLIEILLQDGNLLGYKDIHSYVGLDNMLPEEESLSLKTIVAVVQEIFFIVYSPFNKKKKEEMMDITYYGHTNKKQTLSSALKKEEIRKQNPIMVLAWIKRIESRILINVGVPRNILIRRRELVENILSIQQEIYNNHTSAVFYHFNLVAYGVIKIFLSNESINMFKENSLTNIYKSLELRVKERLENTQ